MMTSRISSWRGNTHHDTYWMRCSVTVISETYWLSSPLTAWEDVGEKYCVPTTPTEMIHQYNCTPVHHTTHLSVRLLFLQETRTTVIW